MAESDALDLDSLDDIFSDLPDFSTLDLELGADEKVEDLLEETPQPSSPTTPVSAPVSVAASGEGLNVSESESESTSFTPAEVDKIFDTDKVLGISRTVSERKMMLGVGRTSVSSSTTASSTSETESQGENSTVVEHFNRGMLNHSTAHSTHRLVYDKQTEDGVVTIMEEEELGPDDLDVGPEILSSDDPALVQLAAERKKKRKSAVVKKGPSVVKPSTAASDSPRVTLGRARSIAPLVPIKHSSVTMPPVTQQLKSVGEESRRRPSSLPTSAAMRTQKKFLVPPPKQVTPERVFSEFEANVALTPIIQKGWLTLGKDVRYFKLSKHKLEFFRGEHTEFLGRISLGYKELVPHGSTKDIRISNLMKSESVTLRADTQEIAKKWIRNLSIVMDDFRQSVLYSKSLSLHKEWVYQDLKVFVGSWNVGNAAPPPSLESFLPFEEDYDIIAIGAQECKYAPELASTCSDDWFGRIIDGLGPKYIVVFRESLWEIRNIVLVRKELAGYVHKVEGATVATGIANTLGNKGGVGIRFYIFDSSFCFINSHLAAHIENVESRNSDYYNITSYLKLGHSDVDSTNVNEYCFWYGDLNYRLDDTREAVLQHIAEGNVEALHDVDQLITELRERRVFAGFTEPKPMFRPTYRYDRNVVGDDGERIYGIEKMRVPSWCDRVLHKTSPGSPLTLVDYHCQDLVQTSDHSPIFNTFGVAARLPPAVLRYVSGESADKWRSTIMPLLSPKQRPEIVFSSLHFQSFSGKEPNCYIKFLSPLLSTERKWKCPVIKRSSTPTWETVKPFPLIGMPAKEYVQNQFITMVFMDDVVGNNNPLGQAVISLQDACSGSAVGHFEEPVYLGGKEYGVVLGDVEVRGLFSASAHLEKFQLKRV